MRKVAVLSFLLFTLIEVYSSTVLKKPSSTSIDQQCFQELGMTQKVLMQAFVEKFKLSEENVKVKKFLACVWKKRGYLNDDGDIDSSKVNKLIKFALMNVNKDVDDMIVVHAVKMCGHIRGVDAGDTAVKVHNCIMDNA